MVILTNKNGYLSCTLVLSTPGTEQRYKECVKCVGYPQESIHNYFYNTQLLTYYWRHPTFCPRAFSLKRSFLHKAIPMPTIVGTAISTSFYISENAFSTCHNVER